MNDEYLEYYIVDACSVIQEFQDSEILAEGPEWARLWWSCELEWSDTDPRYVTMPVGVAAKLVSKARINRFAFDLVRKVASSRITAGVYLPFEMRGLIADWMLGDWTPPPKQRGPDPSTNWLRDFVIHRVSDLLDDRYQLRPTKNLASKPNTRGIHGRDREWTISEILKEAFERADVRLPDVTRTQNILVDRKLKDLTSELYDLYLTDQFENLEPEERI